MTHLSLFSGIGGLDIAAEQAGFKTVAFVEREPFCQKVLRKHWPDVPIHDNVTTFNGTRYRGITLVSGGAPCPEFSAANKHAKGFDSERGQLVFELLRIAQESDADYVLLENAPRVTTTYRSEFTSAFTEYGFNSIPILLDSGSFHSRKRGFYIANTDKVGGFQKLQEISSLVSNKVRDDKAPEQGGVQFILRANADPVFLAECGGESLVAPVFCREDDGVSYRMDRVRALGNAVVPSQVSPILQAIARVVNGP